jgi:hypothetical protein
MNIRDWQKMITCRSCHRRQRPKIADSLSPRCVRVWWEWSYLISCRGWSTSRFAIHTLNSGSNRKRRDSEGSMWISICAVSPTFLSRLRYYIYNIKKTDWMSGLTSIYDPIFLCRGFLGHSRLNPFNSGSEATGWSNSIRNWLHPMVLHHLFAQYSPLPTKRHEYKRNRKQKNFIKEADPRIAETYLSSELGVGLTRRVISKSPDKHWVIEKVEHPNTSRHEP